MLHLLNTAHQVKFLVPVVLPSLVAALHNRIQAEALPANILLTDEVLAELWAAYSEEVHACLESEACTLKQTDEPMLFDLLIIDDETVCIGVHDERMRLLGTITNSSDDVVEWAHDLFHDYWDGGMDVFFRGESGGIGETTTV